MSRHHKEHDLTCLACSLPMVKLANLAKDLAPGDTVKANSDNPGFQEDVRLLCENTGLVTTSMVTEDGVTTVILKKPGK